MIGPKDVICVYCKKTFCCINCRNKHELKVHSKLCSKDKKSGITNCLFCKSQTIEFEKSLSGNLLNETCKKHFPLECRKCQKVFGSPEDLASFSICEKSKKLCQIEKSDFEYGEPKDIENNHKIAMAVATQTSPALFDNVAVEKMNGLTPISQINVRWKIKSKISEGSLTEHTSMRSVSSINNTEYAITHTSVTSSKLSRQTSTPMQRLMCKIKETGFDVSSCHVSSIYSSSSESDISPPIKIFTVTPSPECLKQEENRKKSFNLKGRTKSHAPATPLRQVMSKSIQRAIAEHCPTYSRDAKILPKKIFNSIERSFESPMDLRTTPVLRRTQSDTSEFRREQLMHEKNKKMISQQKHSFDEISSATCNDSGKLETVYESCRSIEASAICFIDENVSCQNVKPVANVIPFTPKIVGGPLKKAISFDSPTEVLNETLEDEVFYTPHKTDSSRITREPTKNNTPRNSPKNTEIYKKQEKSPQQGKIWSLVSSVIRLASGGFNEENKEDANPPSLIKRCASFAGLLSRTKQTEGITAKRKRSTTVEVQSTNHEDSSSQDSCDPKRLKRIQGRQPLERMRKKMPS